MYCVIKYVLILPASLVIGNRYSIIVKKKSGGLLDYHNLDKHTSAQQIIIVNIRLRYNKNILGV